MENFGYKINDFLFINALGLLMLNEIREEREKDLKHDVIIRINLNNHRVLFEEIAKKILSGYFVEDIKCNEDGVVSMVDFHRIEMPIENADKIKHIDLTVNGFKIKIYDGSDNDKEFKINLSFDELDKANELLKEKQRTLRCKITQEIKDLAFNIAGDRLYELDHKINLSFRKFNIIGFNKEAIYIREFKNPAVLPYEILSVSSLYQVRDLLKDVKHDQKN